MTISYRLNIMVKPSHITILAGGPAGLSVGYYARKQGIPFTIYEASDRVGGNCITLRQGDFLFDSGAHRLHDKDEEVTQEIKNLLGEELRRVSAPSQIYYNNQFIDFPLSPLDLLRKIGAYQFSKAGFEFLKSRLSEREASDNFESLALYNYGKIIAESFLLNYSEKLWGLPCDRLSPNVSGKRLKGLDLKTFLIEAISGKTAKTQHLDGSFYYPKMGYGTIVESMAEYCGWENIAFNCKITKIFHNGARIEAIEIAGGKRVAIRDRVASTLPLTLFLQIMEPKPPKEILHLAKSLRYRNLRLVAFFLNKASVTRNATVYFPEADFPFTRIYEPRNRSPHMTPPGKTSLVVEIPCQQEDYLWNLSDRDIIELIKSKLIHIGWIEAADIIDVWSGSITRAYPILEIGFEQKVWQMIDWLDRFSNLKISGRNGKFAYTHLHDMMQMGREIVEEYSSQPLVAVGNNTF